jgi:hypothetical protein
MGRGEIGDRRVTFPLAATYLIAGGETEILR